MSYVAVGAAIQNEGVMSSGGVNIIGVAGDDAGPELAVFSG